MTLSSMATYVCRKVRQSDDAAIARCKLFLAQRAEMLWNEQLWKDALLEAEITLETDGTSSLTDSLWLPDRGTLVLPDDVDRILAVRTTSRVLSPNQREYYFQNDSDLLARTGTAYGYHLLKPVVWEFEEATDLLIVKTGTADANTVVTYTTDGVSKQTATFAATTGGYSITGVLAILQLSCTGALDIQDADSEESIFTMAATLQAMPLRQRVRFVDMPADEFTARVLFKQAFPGFSNDYDLPPVQNMDNCLMAFAQADMLQHARQYGKAQLIQQEALVLLQQLVGLETVQQARRARLVPEDGYDSGYEGGYDYGLVKADVGTSVPAPWRVVNGEIQFQATDGLYYPVRVVRDQGVSTLEVDQEGQA